MGHCAGRSDICRESRLPKKNTCRRSSNPLCFGTTCIWASSQKPPHRPSKCWGCSIATPHGQILQLLSAVKCSAFIDPIVKGSTHPYIPFTCRQFPYSKRILSQNKLSPSFANTFVPLHYIICTQPFHWHIVGSHWFHGSASLCNETFHPLKVVQAFCLEPGKPGFWQLRQSNFTMAMVMPSLWISWLSEDWSLLNWSSVGHRQNSTGQGPEQLNITLTREYDYPIFRGPFQPNCCVTLSDVPTSMVERFLSVTARCN